MTVTEALAARRSIRAFLSEPVPKETISAVLEAALHTPSWANSQPWDVFVASGDTLSRIKQGFLDHYRNAVSGNPEVSRPRDWPDTCKMRTAQLGPDMRRDCGETAKEFGLLNQKMFNAPVVIYLCLDKTLSNWSLFDLGAFQQSILLEALEHGLTTIPAITLVTYPDVIRRELPIPENLNIALGIAIGYEDTEHAINRFRSARKTFGETVRFFE